MRPAGNANMPVMSNNHLLKLLTGACFTHTHVCVFMYM